MALSWTVSVTSHRDGFPDETAAIGNFSRPLDGATPADFGLSLNEAQGMIGNLQRHITQSQIRAYDVRHRRCPHCGTYRQIKDWRKRTIQSALGNVVVRVPRVRSCMCLPEPLDQEGEILPYRESECCIERLLPGRMTPELVYLCAKHGASHSYRSAARAVQDLCGLRKLSHSTVRRKVIVTGDQIEDRQFEVGWFAGSRKHDRAEHLHLAIDSTVISATPYEEVSKFEVIAGRIERDGQMARRFVCALPRRVLASTLVAAALEQSGWGTSTQVDVVNDGAKGMRSLVTAIAPRVAAPILDWFHIGMKLQAIRTPLEAITIDVRMHRPAFLDLCVRLWKKIRTSLWHGKGEKAIALAQMLAASIEDEHPHLQGFYAASAATAHGATKRLAEFLRNNRTILIDYHQTRRDGRRISTAMAESVMNHLINRRLSKRQQMRWSMKGAHCVLQVRVEMLDGRLERHFREHFPHFRSPERM